MGRNGIARLVRIEHSIEADRGVAGQFRSIRTGEAWCVPANGKAQRVVTKGIWRLAPLKNDVDFSDGAASLFRIYLNKKRGDPLWVQA